MRFSTALLPGQPFSHHLQTQLCGRESLLMAHYLKWFGFCCVWGFFVVLFCLFVCSPPNKKRWRRKLPVATRPSTMHWALSKPSQAPSTEDDVTSSDICQMNKQAPTCLPPTCRAISTPVQELVLGFNTLFNISPFTKKIRAHCYRNMLNPCKQMSASKAEKMTLFFRIREFKMHEVEMPWWIR